MNNMSQPRRLNVLAATPAVPAPGSLSVALVNMPCSSSRLPSIQLGLLQALLERQQLTVTSHYLNLAFAAEIGWELADRLAAFYKQCSQLGEWVFSGEAFGAKAPAIGDYLGGFDEPLQQICRDIGVDVQTLVNLREQGVPRFLDGCVQGVDWSQYDVVGFSSVFQQNCAAIALARRLKCAYPKLVTVFGGGNFEGEMGLEYVRTVGCIDYAVIGEGETAFPALLEAVSRGERSPDIPGVAYNSDGKVHFGGPSPITSNLDALPDPNYDDFFRTAAELEMPETVGDAEVALPFESARGCWWGAKHHCTFCGMNAANMGFRSKSPQRVLGELDRLAGRYELCEFMSTDAILDNAYVDAVFSTLQAQKKDYSIFYEVKANLKPRQLKQLAAGGVRSVQPGIESLSTRVLALMNKGVTGIANVRFLKWARYYGMNVDWHILRGFPGEQDADYEAQLETMALIGHLQPPSAKSHRLRLDRFSPNLRRAGEIGFDNVRPSASYGHVYPREMEIPKIAYSFDYDVHSTLAPLLIAAVDACISLWRSRWTTRRPFLDYLRAAEHITIMDGRGSSSRTHEFDGLAARIYEACGTSYATPHKLCTLLRGEDQDIDQEQVHECLGTFVELGLMLTEGDKHLALALPRNRNW